MKVTGSRTPKIREQERKTEKTLGIAGAVFAGVRGCSRGSGPQMDRRSGRNGPQMDRSWDPPSRTRWGESAARRTRVGILSGASHRDLVVLC